MRISGVILDIYDDPQGEVLVNLIRDNPLPEKLASARLLDQSELVSLPDRLFGLVADDGPRRLRKYAMCDEAHVVTSILYFLDRGDVLPSEMQSKVAANLVNACAWYDMDPPEALVKRAMLGKAVGGLGTAAALGLGALEARGAVQESTAKNRQAQANLRATQMGKAASGRRVELSQGEVDGIYNSSDKAVDGTDPYAGRALGASQQISQHGPTHQKLKKQMEPQKKADLNGTEMMPRGTLSKPIRTNPAKNVAVPAKTAAGKIASKLIPEGHVHAGDLRAVEPTLTVKRAGATHFALPDASRYPIDTADQVKTAANYFDEHMHEFALSDRRTFAHSVVHRADELDVSVGGSVLKYAGSGYGPFINSELTARVRGFAGTGHEAVYEMLQEKQASVAPAVMAEMLKEADRATGADQSYGRPGVGFRDPYQAVYGKVAQEAETDKQETYSWSDDTNYVTGPQLNALAAAGRNLDDEFGKGFTERFRKDPVGMFSSLPDPNKVLLSRLASDNSEVRPQI